ncbi:MAG: cytidylate kinase-like family protein [Ignavibacteria bacterium]|nr:cytidylate kinase-like family protein [Ignavibacteria bacterium]
MKVLGSYEKARIYIEKHYEESEEAKRHRRRLNPGPIITISRETGTGAAKICESLIDFLNRHAIQEYNDWAYFDRDLMEKVMEDHNLPDHFKKYLAEEKPAKIDSWFGEILGITPSKLLLLHKTSQTITKLAEYGNVILVGRGANIILSHMKRAFHIRLVAPLNFRIETAMQLYNVDRKTAAEFIKTEDEARKHYILKYFHKNIEDPHLYHAIINTNLLGFDEIGEMIGYCVIKRFPQFFLSSKIELPGIE